MYMSASLKPLNTLSLNQNSLMLVEANSVSDLIRYIKQAKEMGVPYMIIGGGSNIVFTCDYEGMIIKLINKGIVISEDNENVYLTVQAGENWHELVQFTLDKGYFGLENLALIPGSVGAAPIQNIGAYGVEINQFCNEVTYLNTDTFSEHTLAGSECKFDYRDSIFKKQLKEIAVITSVKLAIPKNWQANLSYGPLNHLNSQTVSAKEIYETVCAVRTSKLPDPCKLGNVGSFFKNPIIEAEQYISLLKKFTDLVGYAQADGRIKVAAGWLIDEAGLKGYILGGAAVHSKQALVIVNINQATGDDVRKLAHHVIDTVYNKFGIKLEPEPRIIGSHGEVEL
ncbi:UDP-N-acetylmuramate dehydrogenase [Shewanella sp. MMG014]|uniref:UDP-N-acetylmuramate dehydrogenase n=1 Tax=Shewanella sp. MMG014 TaxID=2822691 RepID=UPI0032B39327